MELSDAIDWAAEHRLGVLITIRADGRPQSSDIVYYVDGGTFSISVTADRAKTANLRRDPRAVLHVSEKAWAVPRRHRGAATPPATPWWPTTNSSSTE